MEDVENLKKKRKSHRGTTTKLLNKISGYLDAEADDRDRLKLKQCLIDLKGKENTIKELDDRILNLMIENGDEEEDKEATEASEVMEKITYGLVSIEDALQEIEQNGCNVSVSSRSEGQTQPLTRSESRESISSAGSQIAAYSRKVKLPKLELRKFTGKVAEWAEFWDGFKSAVHDDPDLAKVDKFKYLRCYLGEPAKSVVTGFSMTDADYDAAVNLLIKRYAKPGAIKRAHINELINLAPVFSENNVERLRHLRDQIETHFRSLEAQGVEKESYSSVVVPVLMEKVPQSLRNNMIRFGTNHMEWNVDDMLEALEKELDVLEGHIPILSGGGKRQVVVQQQRPKSNGPPTASALFSSGKEERARKCPFCLSDDHSADECNTVKDPKDRKSVLFKYGRCFICLNSGHKAFKCRSRINCKLCKGKHHISICSSFPHRDNSKDAQPNASTLDPNASAYVGNTGSERSVALQTALAKVNDKEEGKVRVLFDSGSQKSFITVKAVKRLGLQAVRRERLGIKAFGRSEAEIEMRDVIQFSLGPLHGKKKVRIEAFVVQDIADIPNIHVECIKKDYPHLTNIFFSDVSRCDTLEVGCLVGSDYIWAFQEGEVIRGGPGEPVAVKTHIGWVLSGPLKGKNSLYVDCNVNVLLNPVSCLTNTEGNGVDANLSKLWDLDSIGIRTKEDVHASVIDNIIFTGKRYSVGLPWKVAHKPLPSNYANSVARLKSNVDKLRKTPGILEKYNEVISQQVKDGIVEQVSQLEPASKIHYLPHRAVIRENAETTKLRIVYDASCRDKTGVSLNDCLHVGPALTPLIFDVLLRFRANPVALVSDIAQAFLNIEVHPEDRDCLRFLWLKDVHASQPEILVLRFQRVIFGCNSSPFLLNAVLQHHIRQYEEEDPTFVKKLLGGFFVDDLVTGCKNTDEALSLYEKAKERLKSGGFTLRKWKTNDKGLASEIAKREREKVSEPDVDTSYAKETLGLPNESLGKGKVLGLTWDYEKDTLEFDLGKIGKELNSNLNPTKRSILSTLASLFDPQGLVSPVGITAKILFQELCVAKLGWDDPLPKDQFSRWELWLKDLMNIKTISFPRCILDKDQGEVVRYQLHGFADASKKAYCAVVYLVCKSGQNSYTKLLCAKSRVAPLKQLSIPRLELMSARILATLMDTVIKALEFQLKVDSIHYWLDSKTALYWIFNNGEWKQFVQHRVNEILRLSKKEGWGHVPGNENPADLGSRGCTASHLKDSKLWWEGPEWLKKEDQWPNKIDLNKSEEIEVESKRVNVLVTVEEEPKGVSNVIDIDKFSSLDRLLRVTAYMKRFVRNLKRKKEGKELDTGRLDVGELEEAERVWILDRQKNLKGSVSFKKLVENLGVVEVNDVMVCRGRLANSDLNMEAKFPILLPRDDKFSELIVLDCHERALHSKDRGTLSEFRSRFWVTRGRQYLKKLIKNCFTCRKFEGKSYNLPPTAMLPEFRVTEAPPFSNSGVDFAGPLYVKSTNGEMNKSYIALFTCCVTRAVHLELVDNLVASTFLNCLRRFCARRGTPTLMISDNAKTFKATAKLLEKIVNDFTVVGFLESRRISWRFNIERAAWMGGFFERMVGTVKRCLRKVVGTARLSFDELSTVLTEVETTVNSRPLTYLYDDLEEALTPSHLIYGRKLVSLSEGCNCR